MFYRLILVSLSPNTRNKALCLTEQYLEIIKFYEFKYRNNIVTLRLPSTSPIFHSLLLTNFTCAPRRIVARKDYAVVTHE